MFEDCFARGKSECTLLAVMMCKKGQMPVLQITRAVQKGQNKVPDDT